MNPMKNLLIVLISIVFIISAATSISAQTAEDSTLIKSVTLDYIEGWYTADSARMANALAPDLKKTGFVISHKSGNLQKLDATYSQMVEWTSKKPNEIAQNPDIKLGVDILEIGKNIAVVKTTSPHFTDYLLLGKIDGTWKIYSAIWE
jgi:hypothetical protein